MRAGPYYFMNIISPNISSPKPSEVLRRHLDGSTPIVDCYPELADQQLHVPVAEHSPGHAVGSEGFDQAELIWRLLNLGRAKVKHDVLHHLKQLNVPIYRLAVVTYMVLKPLDHRHKNWVSLIKLKWLIHKLLSNPAHPLSPILQLGNVVLLPGLDQHRPRLGSDAWVELDLELLAYLDLQPWKHPALVLSLGHNLMQVVLQPVPCPVVHEVRQLLLHLSQHQVEGWVYCRIGCL